MDELIIMKVRVCKFLFFFFLGISVHAQSAQYTIGLFGGSYTLAEGSDIVIVMLEDSLSAHVTNYGEHGYGFSALQGSIQDRVDVAGPSDIYILWASTNDFKFNREVGSKYDYTASDNYDDNKRNTQCGGINYCIKKLREKSPKSKIFFISSIPIYTMEAGYKKNSYNKIGYSLYDYVKGQEECSQMQDIYFLNLYEGGLLTEYNYSEYFKPKDLHLNRSGYQLISQPILNFIKNGLSDVTTRINNKLRVHKKHKYRKYIHHKKIVIEADGNRFIL